MPRLNDLVARADGYHAETIYFNIWDFARPLALIYISVDFPNKLLPNRLKYIETNCIAEASMECINKYLFWQSIILLFSMVITLIYIDRRFLDVARRGIFSVYDQGIRNWIISTIVFYAFYLFLVYDANLQLSSLGSFYSATYLYELTDKFEILSEISVFFAAYSVFNVRVYQMIKSMRKGVAIEGAT